MRLRIVKDAVSSLKVLKPGEVVDVNPKDARSLIDGGIAEPWTPESEPAKPAARKAKEDAP
jgi:hypothetical protein